MYAFWSNILCKSCNSKRPAFRQDELHTEQESIPVDSIPPVLLTGRWCCLGGERVLSMKWHHNTPSPVWQTDRYQNITLPQTSFAGGNKFEHVPGRRVSGQCGPNWTSLYKSGRGEQGPGHGGPQLGPFTEGTRRTLYGLDPLCTQKMAENITFTTPFGGTVDTRKVVFPVMCVRLFGWGGEGSNYPWCIGPHRDPPVITWLFLTSGHNDMFKLVHLRIPYLRGSDIWSWVLRASGGTHPTGMRPFLCTCMHSDVYLSMCMENGQYLNLLLNVPYLARVAKKSANA